MAASMVRCFLRTVPVFRNKFRVSPAQRPILVLVKPQTSICRTISQKQINANRRQFHKRLLQYFGLFFFLVVITPYSNRVIHTKPEPRRDRKRRKLQALKEAKEREQSADNLSEFGDEFKETGSDNLDSMWPEEETEKGRNVLPVVRAARVVQEGDGYVPPCSHRFNFIADAVEIAAPSVVYIEIQGRHPRMAQQIPLSNGSGFIVSSDGLILTNAHVVANRIQGHQSVKVKLQDGRMVNGHVVAVDHVSDLAAVKIDDGTNLPSMKLGKSSRLRPGEWVIAMGSPLALSNTITAGIVSAVSRNSRELGLRENVDYIQTDAAIHVGNSGGPLVNLDGEAIGINTMKVTAGISFAIPIDTARAFLEEVQKKMKAGESQQGWTNWLSGGKQSSPTADDKRGYIGITMLSLTTSLLNDLKSRMADFPNITHGVLVYRIVVGSPAQLGGMQAGDIITHIDGKPIKSATDVYNNIQNLKKMEVSVVRGSQKLNLSIVPEKSQ